ncbi:MAG TPA: MFS transporter [Mycobacteriales bacterium]|nr:MFS transporter [Mycobacteriales bacterium]
MGEVAYGTRAGRAVLLATVLGSGVAFLDGTVVNVALPHMARSLSAGFRTMQWVLDAYLLTLGAFVLVGGAVGDLLGRRRVFLAGLAGFAVASAVCGAAPNGPILVVARGVQGLAAALLVPGSLALIVASFGAADRDRAIGTWSGLAGLASAIGPFVGGWLVDAISWRWVFYLNLPLIAVAIAVTVRGVPESRDDSDGDPQRGWRSLDLPGALLAAATLGLLVVPLIETSMALGARVGLFAASAVAAVAFVRVESRRRHPMVPLPLVRGRVFVIANAVTFVVYGALGGAMFLVAVQLQTGLGYSALEAGASLVPLTVMLLLFSSRVGGLVPRVGARPLLAAGPVIAGAGLLLLARATPGASYPSAVLPGVLVFAAGMCLVVAPITSTALGALDPVHAGLASGVNNAVARVASLIAVAVLPAVAGASAGARLPQDGYRLAMVVAAASAAAGGVLALAGLPRRVGVRAPDTVAG